VLALVLALAAAMHAAAAAPAAPGMPEAAATVTPAELTIGAVATVSGRLAGAQPGAGAQLSLQSEPYPFRAYTTIARTSVAADGSFTFPALHLERNTRLRVLVEGGPAPAGPPLTVTVDPQVKLSARTLGRGQTLLSVRIRHALLGSQAPVTASWYLQTRGSHVFSLAALTSTRELAPGVLYASATVDPPSRHFAYRVCINPAWEHAMGARSTHGDCPDHDFVLEAGRAR